VVRVRLGGGRRQALAARLRRPALPRLRGPDLRPPPSGLALEPPSLAAVREQLDQTARRLVRRRRRRRGHQDLGVGGTHVRVQHGAREVAQ
jgi:hypothetical protein